MTSKIRYLAVMSQQPEAISDYYQRYFAMQVFARTDAGDVSLTDGYFNLTVFKLRLGLRELEPRMGVGLNHLGLQVDSLEETKRRYLAFNPDGVVVPEPGGPHYGTLRIHDPEFMPISLSEGSFGVAGDAPRMPRLLHVALNAFRPPEVMRFYEEVLGLRPLARTNQHWIRNGRPNRFMGDGTANLAIHGFYTDNPGHQGCYGVNHFGFMVRGWRGLMEEIGQHYPAAPRPPNRPYEDARVQDPDGNMVDLGETKGWEIDDNVWVNVA
jgi:catechol 2,3-dioxygenase-like lactoylglutathione lyase family enzyme